MLSFCKSCSNLNAYVTSPDKKLMMKCSSCGRPDDNIKDTCVYYNKFVHNSYDIHVEPDQCYDPTLPNTDQIKCLNSTCPSNSPGYVIYVGEKLVELQNTYSPDIVEQKFREMGGLTGTWILDGWSVLNEAEIALYDKRAVLNETQTAMNLGAEDKVNFDTLKNMGILIGTGVPYLPNSRVVFFHYNKDMKLAYICCLCKTYWHN